MGLFRLFKMLKVLAMGGKAFAIPAGKKKYMQDSIYM
jgi:hypothetical protein